MTAANEGQDLVQQAEDAILEMRTCVVEWHILRPLPEELPSSLLKGFDDPERACDAALREKRDERAKAVAPHIEKLEELWAGGLERLVLRHVDHPSRPRQCCRVLSNAVVEAPSLVAVCQWGCDGCCEAILADLKVIRESMTSTGCMPAGGKDRRNTAQRGRPQSDRPEPKSWVDLESDDERILRALPCSGYEGERPTNKELEARTGLSRSQQAARLKDLRKWSLIVRPGNARGYERTEKGDEWVSMSQSQEGL